MAAFLLLPELVAAALREQGIAAEVAFAPSPSRLREGVAVAISLRESSIDILAMGEYLGDEFDAATGRILEVYARRGRVTLAIGCHAVKQLGEASLRETARKVTKVLIEGVCGFSMDQVTWGESRFDRTSGLLSLELTGELEGYLRATLDAEVGVFTDFEIRGEL